MDDADAAYDFLSEALNEVLDVLGDGGESWATLREEILRTGIFHALDRRLPGHVSKERKLGVAAFRGARPSDLLFDRDPGGHPCGFCPSKT